MIRSSLRSALAAAIFVAALPCLGLLEIALDRARLSSRARMGERYYLPPAPVLRALTFGYNELAADLVWLRAIAYFTDRLVAERDFSHLHRYVDTALALDDHFREIYRFAPPMFLNRGERQTNDDVFEAIEILRRGHARYPEDWRFPFSIGANYMTELHSPSKAKRARWRRIGADWIRRAALLGSDLPWLPSLAAKIYTEQGQRQLAIKHLQELYLTTQDQAMKQQIAGKLKALQAAQLADELQQQARAFEQRYRQSEISYVSRDLFVLLDLPPLEPFSLTPPGEGDEPASP